MYMLDLSHPSPEEWVGIYSDYSSIIQINESVLFIMQMRKVKLGEVNVSFLMSHSS